MFRREIVKGSCFKNQATLSGGNVEKSYFPKAKLGGGNIKIVVKLKTSRRRPWGKKKGSRTERVQKIK